MNSKGFHLTGPVSNGLETLLLFALIYYLSNGFDKVDQSPEQEVGSCDKLKHVI